MDTNNPGRGAPACLDTDLRALAEQMQHCRHAHRQRWRMWLEGLLGRPGTQGVALAAVLFAGAWLLR